MADKRFRMMDIPKNRADALKKLRQLKTMGVDKKALENTLDKYKRDLGLTISEGNELYNDLFEIERKKIGNEAIGDFDKMLKEADEFEQDLDINKKGPLSKDEQRRKTNKEKVIKRINEIIMQVNSDNMGGRYTNYIRGGTGKGTGKLKRGSRKYPSKINQNYSYQDPQTGLQHLSQSSDGYNLQESMYPRGKMMRLDKEYKYQGAGIVGGGSYGHSLEYQGAGMNEGLPSVGWSSNHMPIGAGKRKRKPRADRGRQRGESDWIKFVRAVCAEYDLPYKQGMSKASKLRKEGYVLEDFM